MMLHNIIGNNHGLCQKHFVVEERTCMTLWRILRKSLRSHSAVGF